MSSTNRCTITAEQLLRRPAAERLACAPALMVREAARGPLLSMHALIIEDEFLAALCIQDCLSALGFTSFAFAMDEDEACAAASEQVPDLITSDVQLATGCGIDAVQRILSQQPIPILYITGSEALVRERCPEAIIIQKPFGVAQLRDGIRDARRAA